MKIMKIYTFLITFGVVVSTEYVEIKDIPIEDFDHSGDLQENDMDLELLQTKSIQFAPETFDPKHHFFRSSRSYDYDSTNLPRPNGFQNSAQIKRQKRDVDDEPIFVHNIEELQTENPKNEGLVTSLGKPSELSLLDTESDATTSKNIVNLQNQSLRAKKELEINDFIRFKRSVPKNVETKKNSAQQQYSSNKQSPLTHSEKLVMESSNIESTRDPREANPPRENWPKQNFPSRRMDEFAFDNMASSSENVKAPRVNFVTQRLSESQVSSSEYRPYAREARARDFNVDLPKDLFNVNGPRYSRQYSSLERPYYRDEFYSRYDPRINRDVRQRYEPERDTMYPSSTNYQRQKRIIYYATLPDVSRSPPNVDLRDRFGYNRDRYDDPYIREPYRLRKVYPTSRYEQEQEHDRAKIPYPLKVSADVNVREVKKNPERRIYSEVDLNRYGYDSPYQTKRN